MVDPSLFWVFLAGALLLNITPGPDFAFTLATSARGGVRAGLAAALGVSAGCLVWAGLAAGGLAALLAASEQALTALRIAGGLYLLYLAVKTARMLDAMPAATAQGRAGALQAFRAGLVTNLLNPKVGIFFLAFLPAFTNPAVGPVWIQSLVLGAVFSATGALVLCGVAVAAGSVQARLAASARLRKALGAVAATAFAGLGLRLLLSRS